MINFLLAVPVGFGFGLFLISLYRLGHSHGRLDGFIRGTQATSKIYKDLIEKNRRDSK